MPSDWALRKLQFRTLYRVFLLRIFDLELLSADGDLTRLLGQFASIFATFSFCITAPLVLTRGALEMTQAWMFEHFLIETAMTVAGLIAVLNWDAAFPDKRDVLVLAPLPVKRSILLLAKIAALLAAPALAIISLNIFSGVVWPLLFRSPNSGFVTGLKSFPAYWITIFAAGAFFVFTALTIQGLAANLLPGQLFPRVSAVLQACCLCLLLSTYFLEPSLESPAALSSPHNQRLLGWLPSYWFFALFNQLNGSMDLSLVPLAKRAWAGLAVSVFGACAALLLCYVRMMRQMVEQPDILPGARSITWWPRFGSSLLAAITLFSLRTLMRSRQHRMILSFYLGLGITIVVGYAKTTMGGFGSAGRNSQQLDPVCKHSDDGPWCFGFTSCSFVPNFASRELDYPHDTNSIGSRLPESCSLFVAGVGSLACLAHHRGLSARGLSLAPGVGSSRCIAVPGSPSYRTLPIHFREDPFHLLLSSGQRTYSFRFLGLPDVLVALAKSGSGV